MPTTLSPDPFTPLSQDEGKSFAEYLEYFDRGTKKKGTDYYLRGMVKTLSCIQVDRKYMAYVKGTSTYAVTLEYDDGDWYGECTCPVEMDCKHAYAAALTLMNNSFQENEREAMTSAAAKTGKQPIYQAPAGNRAQASVSHLASLAKIQTSMEAALERHLHKEEDTFLVKLSKAFEEYKSGLTYQPNVLALLQNRIYQPSALELPTGAKTDIFEFYHCLAHVMTTKYRIAPPEFMTHLEKVQPAGPVYKGWIKKTEIDFWGKLFKTNYTAPDDTQKSEVQLRMLLRKEGLTLEYNQLPGTGFRRCTGSKLKELILSFRDQQIDFPPVSQQLWTLFLSHTGDEVFGNGWAYDNNRIAALVDELIHTPSLEAVVLNEAGKPFIRPQAPLTWQLLLETGSEDEWYRLALTKPDGEAFKDPTLLLIGRPAPGSDPGFVLTADTIWKARLPVCINDLDLSEPQLMPVEALATPEGITFLSQLGVDMPGGLQERIHKIEIRLQVSVRELVTSEKKARPGIAVELFALGNDGKAIDTYQADGWRNAAKKMVLKNQPKNRIIVADRSALAHASRIIGRSGVVWDWDKRIWYRKYDADFVGDFQAWIKNLPEGVELNIWPELRDLLVESQPARITVDLRESGMDWFDLRLNLSTGDIEFTADEIKILLKAKGQFVNLPGKGWKKLELDADEKAFAALDALGSDWTTDVGQTRRVHLLQLIGQMENPILADEIRLKLRQRIAEFKQFTPPLPKQIEATLRPYQMEGFHYLSTLAGNRLGGILADDMGLGKTLQALCWMAWLLEQDPSGCILIVCPKSLVGNWRAEALRFFPSLRVARWRPGMDQSSENEINKAQCLLVNYQQLRLAQEFFATKDWKAVILDEAQHIKNPDSITAKICHHLRASQRLILTGTPIENRLTDLWSLMQFAMPGILPNKTAFRRDFEKNAEPRVAGILRSRIRPFILRRTKSQVAKDLPPRTEEDIICEMESAQKAAYMAELKTARQILSGVANPQEYNKKRFNILTSLLRLRQICNHPALAKIKTDKDFIATKVEALDEVISPLIEEGHKVLIFSQFVEMITLLTAHAKKAGWPLHVLTGQSENREQIVESFQTKEGGGVFLISLKAGGFGLNLTAAQYVVLFDPWWNPAVENQAIDRAHRIGQDQHVIAYRLIVKDSIEEKIRLLQKKKKALAEGVVDEESFAQTLSLDDMRFLIETSLDT